MRMSAETAISLVRAHEITLDRRGQIRALVPMADGKVAKLPLLTDSGLKERGTK